MSLKRQRGSQLVEAGLAMLPLFAMVFLVIDISWGIWVKATLQHAVREAVRYAVTGQTQTGSGQTASIKAVAQTQAMGLLSGSQATTLHVRFYDSTSLAETSSNIGGNVVEVAVENFSMSPLAALLRSNDPYWLTVRAADIIEPSPGGIAPAP
jgi:Flp pilus assembly protein TadG